MDFEYFLSKITDFSKVLRISKKGITFAVLSNEGLKKSDCQERPHEGLTRRNVIGVWLIWLAHLVWGQRVSVRVTVPRQKVKSDQEFGSFFVITDQNIRSANLNGLKAGKYGMSHHSMTKIGCGSACK